MFSLLARSDLRRRRANCCPPPTRRGWNLTTPPSPAFLRWPPAKNSFAFKAVQSDHIRIKQENDNRTQTAQYAAQTHFEYWILQCPIPRILKNWILQYIQYQKYQDIWWQVHAVQAERMRARSDWFLSDPSGLVTIINSPSSSLSISSSRSSPISSSRSSPSSSSPSSPLPRWHTDFASAWTRPHVQPVWELHLQRRRPGCPPWALLLVV